MMAFERLEPFGGLALQFNAGQIAATMANCHRNPKDVPEPFSAVDFMPALRQAHERAVAGPQRLRGEDLSPDELSALLDASIFGKTAH